MTPRMRMMARVRCFFRFSRPLNLTALDGRRLQPNAIVVPFSVPQCLRVSFTRLFSRFPAPSRKVLAGRVRGLIAPSSRAKFSPASSLKAAIARREDGNQEVR